MHGLPVMLESVETRCGPLKLVWMTVNPGELDQIYTATPGMVVNTINSKLYGYKLCNQNCGLSLPGLQAPKYLLARLHAGIVAL